MKRTILSIFFIYFMTTAIIDCTKINFDTPMIDEWTPLIDALIQVESGGDPRAHGSHDDRGVLQITPILVQEVNRISGGNYTHDDAWDPEKSVEMFRIIADKYCPEKDYEKMARIWNGGPKGHTKEYTKQYWNKVYKELERKVLS